MGGGGECLLSGGIDVVLGGGDGVGGLMLMVYCSCGGGGVKCNAAGSTRPLWRQPAQHSLRVTNATNTLLHHTTVHTQTALLRKAFQSQYKAECFRLRSLVI